MVDYSTVFGEFIINEAFYRCLTPLYGKTNDIKQNYMTKDKNLAVK